jgi:hydrogenase maturation protease
MPEPVRGEAVVIGLGSPLMGDDGLGLLALEALSRRCAFEPEPRFVDGGTWGMNLLPIIESAERLLFVDAIRAGGTPGELVVIERDALPRGLGIKLSPHQIDLQDVLALAELRGCLTRDAVAIGLEPERVELGVGVSPAVARGLDALIEQIVLRLAGWGHALTEGDGNVHRAPGKGRRERRPGRDGRLLRDAPQGESPDAGRARGSRRLRAELCGFRDPLHPSR